MLCIGKGKKLAVMEDNKNSLEHLKILLGELLDSLNESNRALTEKVEKLGRKVEDLSIRIKELEEKAGADKTPDESGLVREDAGQTAAAERPEAGSGEKPEESMAEKEEQESLREMEEENPEEENPEVFSFEMDWQPSTDAGFEIVSDMESGSGGNPAGEDRPTAAGEEEDREDSFMTMDSGNDGDDQNTPAKETVPKTVLDAVRPDWYDWEVDYPAPYIDDVLKGIALNDKLLFVRELFGEDEELFKNTLEKINTMENFKEVVAYMREHYPQWNEQSDEVYRFYMAVRRRYNR